MSLIYMSGCSLSDTEFTLDARITGEEITWNVTRLQRDAERGVFGKPHLFPLAALPPMTDEDRANIDWEKVARIIEYADVLGAPVIAIGSARHSGGIFCFVDGNHRLCARQLAGLTDFEVYIAPHEIERRYRITIMKVED